jgi:hypothetical protein
VERSDEYRGKVANRNVTSINASVACRPSILQLLFYALVNLCLAVRTLVYKLSTRQEARPYTSVNERLDLRGATKMASQQFYLLGESISSARTISLDGINDLEGLRNLIASHFAIVEPSGESNSNV